MQLRRALPLSLSLVALLASTGCVSVDPEGAGSGPGPGPGPALARGSVPPVAAPDVPLSLPLGNLPSSPAPEPDRDPEPGPEPSPVRASKAPHPPRRGRTPGTTTAHPRRKPVPPPSRPRTDELCAAADGAVPPSIVDLCLRQFGR
ncbi:hypothetical protein OG625_34850 [Streptomyces sp. NBC_01351]|uniref:hypothetical protein n=1 Tax=Streptomyces sp. NBC_01351 TaxID=2903833 RepID=UPI002E36AB3C|nr:hypothetical protein [Streptomyces sp. NBC_01351]